MCAKDSWDGTYRRIDKPFRYPQIYVADGMNRAPFDPIQMPGCQQKPRPLTAKDVMGRGAAIEKMEGDSTEAALAKPNNNFALALFTENKRRKTFNCVSAIAAYVDVAEFVRWGFYLDVDLKTASKLQDNLEELSKLIVCCAFCRGKCRLKTFFITSESSETIRLRHRHLPPSYEAYSNTGKCFSNVEFSSRALSKGYPSDDEDFNPNRKKMLSNANRLCSLEFFPKRYIVSTDEMARWGQYYTGIRDETACIFCRLIIHNWEYGDNPYEEHHASSELIVEEDVDFHHLSGVDAQGGEK
ncbi:unnamed protein product [Darwinula stevensoni]|uniref:Uncharacterized protein n=1 Tax=Darwinula stevensoni TaxID=69355 RepID=A0A7R8XB71_9CRUS|nr:unnamed protein product [Darwinula stevensoni]CAG0892571.1 unnamed protein product [Darwinula stevensoni]